jgi:hypothetical protein
MDKFRTKDYRFSEEEFIEYIKQFELTPYQQRFYDKTIQKKKKYGRGEFHFVYKGLTTNRKKVKIEMGYSNDYDVDSQIISTLLHL